MFCWCAFGGSKIDRKVSVGVCHLCDQTTADWVGSQHCPCFAKVKHCSALVSFVSIESRCSRLIFACTSDAERVVCLIRRVAVLVSATFADSVSRVKIALENHAASFPCNTMVNDWW